MPIAPEAAAVSRPTGGVDTFPVFYVYSVGDVCGSDADGVSEAGGAGVNPSLVRSLFI